MSMKEGFRILVILGVIFLVSVLVYFLINKEIIKRGRPSDRSSELLLPSEKRANTGDLSDFPRVSVFAAGFDTPWSIAFLPNKDMLVTERPGRVRLVSKDGLVRGKPVAIIPAVKELSEGGLHGIALHPDFENNNYVYVYYTYEISKGNTFNRVVRFTFDGDTFKDEKIIVDGIPGAPNHDGGRIKFGPDNMLYITTGDAQNPSLAQDVNSLAGKILRVTEDGNPAPGNPFGNRVYSYGHRNPQGITWDSQGQLWEVEHGPSGLETGNDEFNKIEIGKNYGWPEIWGRKTKEGMVAPVLESGRKETWAPAGLSFLGGKFYFAGLRGETLYELSIGKDSFDLKRHLVKEFGRLREVVVGPDGLIYVTTSNRDGRGVPKEGDDKILRVNPYKL